ncbi:MAG: UvrD-helicase domain-containing protein [Pirellulaceae bacterium]|nr:UvrD-helicase domain-containing protein [Pirellulaceae bacterium]
MAKSKRKKAVKPALNPPQHEAVHTTTGPLLVLAGAGTGKTRVVTFRIAELIRHGTRPNRILGVTFTNKAANEMQQRIRELLGRRDDTPQISTFHSHCVRVLRRHITHLGYPQNFSIYDRSDQLAVARQVLRELRVGNEVLRSEELIGRIGSWKSAAVRPPQAAQWAETDRDHLASIAYRRYQTAIKTSGAVDFDDLLLLTDDLFTDFPEVRREEANHFDHILVDEYQDTSQCQYRIIKFLALGHRNLCVVGDDDQSIYGWRGAEVQHILRFQKDWPDAKCVRLEDNYRSSQEILEVANRLIRFNNKRFDKELRSNRQGGSRPQIVQYRDETKEATGTVADIQRCMKRLHLDPRDFCILFRTNEQPRPFEEELRRADVPYTLVGSTSFFDRKEVRDILAYLKTIHQPRDEISLLRIINSPPRGIGKKTVQTLLDQAVKKGCPIWNLIQSTDHNTNLSGAGQASLASFCDLIQQLQNLAQYCSVSQLVSELIGQIRYQDEIERLYTDPLERQSRWAAVEEVVNAAATFEKRKGNQADLHGFLDELAVAAGDMESDKEKDLKQNAVALMTLHSAKGLEFPYVYMVGMEEGILPHHRSLKENGDDVDEERRLCYVGLTRAQDGLTLSMSQSRMKWGKPRSSTPSRFLYELSGQTEKL